jgi:Restriction endonuclease
MISKDVLPSSVRYVKNGRSGRWWKAARENGQIHAGWKNIPDELLLKKNLSAIETLLREQYGDKQGAKQDINQVLNLLDSPSKHLWITFEDDCLWWCTVRDGVTANPEGETAASGHFWLTCARPWSKTSLTGRLLSTSELPGTVTTTAGFRATVCTPKDSEAILRLIKGETDKDAIDSADRRREYELAVHKIVQRLSPQDFEHLIDLILGRTGWERIAVLGGTREGVDVEAENPAADEIAFVQVKSSAGQDVLDDYTERFRQRRERYSRMIFAVHTPSGRLAPPRELPVQVWTGEKVAKLVVRLGLGKWVESRLS